MHALVVRVVEASRKGVRTARADGALERLLALCLPVAERMAWPYRLREADVADLAQESLIYVARHIGDLREPAAFPHWFATVVHSTGLQWLRRERRRAPDCSLELLARGGPGSTGSLWTFSRWPLQPVQPSAAAADGLRALDAVEALDVVRRLLRVLQPREREAVVRFFLDDQPQRDIARRMDLTPKAVENLVYRALRRLRLVAAQCGDEMEDLLLWCPGCGGCQLQGRLQPGDAPERPLAVRATCPRCSPGNNEAYNLVLPRPSYPSVEAALLAGMGRLGAMLQACARAARAEDLRCVYCGATLRRSPRSDVRRGLSWRCRACPALVEGGVESLAAAVPELRDLWLATPRLRFGPTVVAGAPEGDRVIVEAADAAPAVGGVPTRGFTLVLAADTLAVRALEVRSGQEGTR